MSVMIDGAERDQKTRQNKYMASPPNTDSIVEEPAAWSCVQVSGACLVRNRGTNLWTPI